ncbi:UDP-glucose--hexose-1-phosphate uridylyltransferase [Marispirochaeta sp.]|uniref:UDP-glucose--hexose-1-phosphate uridylyltransferase n=1 Tax=Marispirochaeta sp. TaxID=2038653 RepID=UPI0029C88AE5|nr:UDP-glucose--hexose-1-phosphate uridylyltransferase [Marispirochaeta sp.]
MNSIQKNPHRRFNPLSGEWLVVSPQRTQRPWQGQEESEVPETLLSHDPNCYLCPGNSRAGGARNPEYRETYSFINDFSALLPEQGDEKPVDHGLFYAVPERGICKVICFSPRHDLTVARMSSSEIRRIVDLWIAEYRELSMVDFISYVQIFENRGEVMGCSNPHPHGQIWSNENIPELPAKETQRQKAYFDTNKSLLLLDYLDAELKNKERIIYTNKDFVVLVPFWALWPYETMILPRRRVGTIDELEGNERDNLADAISKLTIRYDNLFRTSFPYSMGIHGAPCDGKAYQGWQMHLHYYPPLLRSASIKKFMVGYELLATPQRDITPEQAAAILRELPEKHYLEVKRD